MNLDEAREIVEFVAHPRISFEVFEQPGCLGLQVHSEKWGGRKWRVSFHATKSELVQTCLLAVLTFVEHEARELFTYREHAIFGPHFDVDGLVDLAKSPLALDLRAETGK